MLGPLPMLGMDGRVAMFGRLGMIEMIAYGLVADFSFPRRRCAGGDYQCLAMTISDYGDDVF